MLVGGRQVEGGTATVTITMHRNFAPTPIVCEASQAGSGTGRSATFSTSPGVESILRLQNRTSIARLDLTDRPASVHHMQLPGIVG